ncbi:hypothetical protein T484DRAFT_1788471, partial [Baffinella frigidus]
MLEVKAQLEHLLSFPPRNFKNKTVLQRSVECHSHVALEEIRSGLDALLCDQHGSFAAPEDEIPPAVEALEVLPRGGDVPNAKGQGSGVDVTTQRALTRVIRGSVRSHYATIYRAKVGQGKEVDVDGCIEVVEIIPEELEAEVLFFSPGFAAVFPPGVAAGIASLESVLFFSPGFAAVFPPGVAAGIASLEYVRCCCECVGE